MSGIRDILVISTPEDVKNYSNLIGDGKNFGINVSYDIQPTPDGIAQALIIAENFLTNQPSALMLADKYILWWRSREQACWKLDER